MEYKVRIKIYRSNWIKDLVIDAYAFNAFPDYYFTCEDDLMIRRSSAKVIGIIEILED